MILDNKGRLFGKVNIIDLLVILAVIAAAVFTAKKLAEGTVLAVYKQYEVEFYTEEVADFVIEKVHQGGLLVDESKGSSFGYIISEPVTSQAIMFNPDSDGKLVSSGKEGYSSAYFTSLATASPFENGIMIDGNKYVIGHSFTVRAGQGKIFLRISNITEKGSE